MEILEKINKDLVASMKNKDDLRTTTLRMIKSSIKNAEIAKRGKGELIEEDILGVLSTMVKQRKESVEQYQNAGRNDLADKENREIEVIQEYLPKQLSIEEVDAIIKSTIQEAGILGMKDMGRLMKELMPKVKGKADEKLVSRCVKEILEKTG
ncbi:MAG: GatB/YqeY domain-containing protein [Thermodesulfovibrionales bacterium]|nr:GatB/YqeY domain-containing protein [Thermodesulfovibrionales bacterium]